MTENKWRIEKDSMGTYKVPAGAKYGIFTARAGDNFRISGKGSDMRLIYSLTRIKQSYAIAHTRLNLLSTKDLTAILESCEEILAGKHDKEFIIDKFQAGAGTPVNMNVNEVIANLANEKSGKPPGSYIPVNPNDTVNMGQSTNNVVPVAIRLAILGEIPRLINELCTVQEHFIRLAAGNNILKVGRTHLQDAVPVSYRQVFAGYVSAIGRLADDIRHTTGKLREIPVNGTALGTGIASHPRSGELMCAELSKLTEIDFFVSDNPVELSWNTYPFSRVAGSLRDAATVINKIANDFRLLASGPDAGIAEVILPEVEPGSSVMPGKINPSIPECLNMICYQVMGNCEVVNKAGGEGQLELNVMTPVIAENILESIDIFSNGLRMFSDMCLTGLELHRENIKQNLDKSLVFATALNPYLGYQVVAQLVMLAREHGLSLTVAITKYKLIDTEHIRQILNPERVTAPHEADTQLVEAIRSSQAYQEFVEQYVR